MTSPDRPFRPAPRSAPRLLLALALAAAFSGCGLLGGGGGGERGTIHAPVVRVDADPSWPRVEWQLSVANASAPRMVDSPRINVRPSPAELQVYAGASWAQPATDMLETTVLRALEDSGHIDAVARSEVGIRPDYKLVMEVHRFESDYAGSAVPSATIEVTAKLLYNRDQRLVASRTFLAAHQASGTAVPEVVAAFEAALAEVGAGIAGWTLASGEADWKTLEPPL